MFLCCDPAQNDRPPPPPTSLSLMKTNKRASRYGRGAISSVPPPLFKKTIQLRCIRVCVWFAPLCSRFRAARSRAAPNDGGRRSFVRPPSARVAAPRSLPLVPTTTRSPSESVVAAVVLPSCRQLLERPRDALLVVPGPCRRRVLLGLAPPRPHLALPLEHRALPVVVPVVVVVARLHQRL